MTMSLAELRRSPYHQELARKMCAAYIAQQQGIALNTAMKKVSGPIGNLWFLVAEFARRGCLDSADLDALAVQHPPVSGFVV
jgi:hypothetical protein